MSSDKELIVNEDGVERQGLNVYFVALPKLGMRSEAVEARIERMAEDGAMRQRHTVPVKHRQEFDTHHFDDRIQQLFDGHCQGRFEEAVYFTACNSDGDFSPVFWVPRRVLDHYYGLVLPGMVLRTHVVLQGLRPDRLSGFRLI